MRDVEQNREHYTKLVSQSEETSITGSWGSNQEFRYKILADKKVFGGGEKSILEIGCGTGGFLEYLERKGLVQKGKYCGIDIVPEMEKRNRLKWSEYEFETVDIINEEFNRKFDIVCLCGVFNLKTDNGKEYMEKMLLAAYEKCKECLTFNFISTYVNYVDDGMEYHNPVDVMRFCIENLSRKVTIIHHYEKCDVACRIFR